MRIAHLGLPLVTIAALASTAEADRAKLVRHPAAITNQYIVVMKDSALSARGAASIDRFAQLRGVAIRKRFTTALRGFSTQLTETEALALADDPDVAYVSENGRVYASAIRDNATTGLDRIDQAALPLDGKFVELGNGEGVSVFIIDTGIRATHVELAGRVLTGVSTVDDGLGPDDCHGHGTHVAGTVGGKTFGVAKGVSLVPIRVLDCNGSGTIESVVGGIDFVAANAPKSSVANLSLGGGANVAIDTAIKNLVASGVTTVVAAGNEDQDACNASPARERTAITVAASQADDVRAVFSNFGPCVDLFAPGVDITSAGIASNTATEVFSGTSMASPHVAGVAAAFLGGHPGTLPADVATAIVAGAVNGKITDPRGAPNKLLQTSFLDVEAPAAAFLSPTDGAKVGSSFTVEADITEPNLERVELSIDRKFVEKLTAAPFKFTVSGLGAGTHTLELTAFDIGGKSTTETIAITVGDDSGNGGDEGGDSSKNSDLTAGCSAGAGAGGLPLLLGALGFLLRRRTRALEGRDVTAAVSTAPPVPATANTVAASRDGDSPTGEGNGSRPRRRVRWLAFFVFVVVSVTGSACAVRQSESKQSPITFVDNNGDGKSDGVDLDGDGDCDYWFPSCPQCEPGSHPICLDPIVDVDDNGIPEGLDLDCDGDIDLPLGPEPDVPVPGDGGSGGIPDHDAGQTSGVVCVTGFLINGEKREIECSLEAGVVTCRCERNDVFEQTCNPVDPNQGCNIEFPSNPDANCCGY